MYLLSESYLHDDKNSLKMERTSRYILFRNEEDRVLRWGLLLCLSNM
ncbi:hypothetical protein FHW74_001405 [Atlantibacter sp. RC6]|nr:hypothetical protein [Atlantibacter sp. RC6]